MRDKSWINYEVEEEEWKKNWKKHTDIMIQLQEQGLKINLIIYPKSFLFKGE